MHDSVQSLNVTDDPIDFLRTEHERILETMLEVETLSNEIMYTGSRSFIDRADRWRSIRGFLQHDLALHARDEEECLFPMIAKSLAAPVELMGFEHDWLEQSQDTFIEMLDSLLAGRTLADGTHCRQFALLAKEFAHMYREHIYAENNILLAASKGLLTQLERVELMTNIISNRVSDPASIASAA